MQIARSELGRELAQTLREVNDEMATLAASKLKDTAEGRSQYFSLLNSKAQLLNGLVVFNDSRYR